MDSINAKELVALIHQLRMETWSYTYALWKMEFFSPRWIAIVIFLGIAYTAWWKLVDKRRLGHLLLFGALLAVMRIIYENTIVGMGGWTYQVRIFPMSVSLFLPSLTVNPLLYMLIYQYTASWRSFSLWSIVWSGLWDFAILPLFGSFDILIIHNWQYYYGFIATLAFGILARFFSLLVLNVEQGYSIRNSVSSVPMTALQPVLKPLENEGQQDKE